MRSLTHLPAVGRLSPIGGWAGQPQRNPSTPTSVGRGRPHWAAAVGKGSTGCAMQAGLATPASETSRRGWGQSGSRKARLAAGRDVWADSPTLAAWVEWPLHITNPSSFSPIVGYGGIWPGWDGKLLVS